MKPVLHVRLHYIFCSVLHAVTALDHRRLQVIADNAQRLPPTLSTRPHLATQAARPACVTRLSLADRQIAALSAPHGAAVAPDRSPALPRPPAVDMVASLGDIEHSSYAAALRLN